MRFPSPVFSSVIFLCVLVAAELGCGGGSASLQKNSSNPGQPQVPSISFSAQPSTVSSGASATLSWTSSNATAVTITGLGTFSVSGSVQVTPAATTTYSAVASGPAGSTDTSDRKRDWEPVAGTRSIARSDSSASSHFRGAGVQSRLCRCRGEPWVLKRDRKFLDAIFQQSGIAVRCGDAVLRRHPSFDRKLLYADYRPGHYEQ